jgi:hypothetical protein
MDQLYDMTRQLGDSLNNTSTFSTNHIDHLKAGLTSSSSKADPASSLFGAATNFSEQNESQEDDPQKAVSKAKKKALNRESAARSRLKKKSYFENIEAEYLLLQKESNQLKLENAGLRAEN